MPVTLQEAIDDFYEIAVQARKTTSTLRLSRLAEYCVEHLADHGVAGSKTEVRVAGIGRDKKWDVAWEHNGKIRLAISLKSILKNLAGTVPNRLDDLIGEVANVQLASPEIVTGYLIVYDVAAERQRLSGQPTWREVLETRLGRLSSRGAPVWSFGMIEAFGLIQVDFSEGPRLLTSEDQVLAFLEKLAKETLRRNPV